MGRVFTSYPVLQTAVYVGPGDVVSGATGFWSLRAYSNASIGSNVVRLRGTDTVESDFITVTGGGLDPGIAAWTTLHGGPATIVTLYDQTGNGHDVTQATVSEQPFLNPAALGSLPTITPQGTLIAGHGLLITSGAFALSAPYSWILVAMMPVGGGICTWQESAASPVQFNASASPSNQWGGFDIGSGIPFSVTEDVWHTAAVTQAGGPSNDYLDGSVAGSGSPFGGGTAMSGVFKIGVLRGQITEAGVYPFVISGGQATALDANQSAYWSI